MKAGQKIPPHARLGLIPLLAALSLPVCAAGPKAQPEATAPSVGIPGAPARPVVDTKLSMPQVPGKPGHATLSRIVVRQHDESLEKLAARILPSGAYPMTNPVEFQFPPLGKVILVLYQASADDLSVANDPSVYRGWVLVPDGTSESYRIEPLPSQPEGVATLMYEVKSVFTADADGEGALEICILSEIAETGRGDSGRSFTDTDVFKWSGSGFTM